MVHVLLSHENLNIVSSFIMSGITYDPFIYLRQATHFKLCVHQNGFVRDKQMKIHEKKKTNQDNKNAEQVVFSKFNSETDHKPNPTILLLHFSKLLYVSHCPFQAESITSANTPSTRKPNSTKQKHKSNVHYW
jgi:hypothetical protein